MGNEKYTFVQKMFTLLHEQECKSAKNIKNPIFFELWHEQNLPSFAIAGVSHMLVVARGSVCAVVCDAVVHSNSAVCAFVPSP
jgi:hypothetical protein